MTILAAVGEKSRSDRLVETAVDLATAYDDDLEVLHVIPEDEADEHFRELKSIPGFADISMSIEDRRAEEIAERVVEEALDDYDRSRISPLGRVGDPTEEILAAADDLAARYVVIGGKKRSPTGKALFGSVTQSVLLNSEIPTVTVMASD